MQGPTGHDGVERLVGGELLDSHRLEELARGTLLAEHGVREGD